MLGHASIEQTSTYLNVRAGGLLESMRRLDAARIRGNLVANEAPIAGAKVDGAEGLNDREVTVN
jgi:hypothetical protein